MKAEQSRAITIPYIGGKDVMPITGYFGPYPHDYEHLPYYFTDEIFKLIADSGINLMVYSAADYASHPELVEKNLEFCEKYGVGVFVTDSNVIEKRQQGTITVEEVKRELEKYQAHKAFCGMYVVDEPGTDYYLPGNGSRLLPTYKRIAEILQKDLDILCYINAFPAANWVPDWEEKYEPYLNEFCETLQPKVLCWDYYPFDKGRQGKMEYYFHNMNLIREVAKKKDIPFWAFIQAGSQWNDSWNKFEVKTPYYPNEPQFNWNVNTSLAFGAQGIQYFPLLQPVQFTLTTDDEGDYECNGIIGAMGNKTQWYDYAQKINKHIAAIDEVLMNSVHKGILASGEQTIKDMSLTTCVIESGVFEQLKSITGDAMVGCFNYQGKTALYVVNYSFEHAQNVKLTFDGVQNMKMIQNAKTATASVSEITLDMAAGEGILIVIQ